VWPSLKDPEQLESAIVLKDPGPSTQDEFYPIPISAWEDMQQEDFWEIHIRKFGHSSLHYRDGVQGAQVTYAPPLNPAQEFSKKTRQVRVTGNSRVENQQFRSSMAALQKQALERSLEMTPGDRDAMKFGRTFILSSSAEVEFWDQSAQQTNAVDSIITTVEAILRNPNQRPQDRHYLTTELLTGLQKAIENHEMMIAAILSVENTNGVSYTNRRKTLLSWNRGTRTFMNRIMGLQFAGSLATSIQDLLSQLERARMVLWAYNDIPNGLDTDVAEITLIRAASNQAQQGLVNQCLNTCRTLQLSVRPSVTTVTRFTVTMVVFETVKNVFINWQIRRKIMTDLFPAIDWLLSAAPITWRGHLQMLKDNYNRLLTLPEPPAPPTI
jgi:hypothetical protein